MATTLYVELRTGEQWGDVAGAFMLWCLQERQVATGGCNEGEAGGPADGRRYAAISIPDHSTAFIAYMREWAAIENRCVG